MATKKKVVKKKTTGKSTTSQIMGGVVGGLLQQFLGGYGTNLGSAEGGKTVTKKTTYSK